jgi:hypothetical protein
MRPLSLMELWSSCPFNAVVLQMELGASTLRVSSHLPTSPVTWPQSIFCHPVCLSVLSPLSYLQSFFFFSLRCFHIKTQQEFPLFTVCKVRPTHLIVLGFITLIIFSTEYKSCSSLCNILQSHFTSCLAGPHVFFSTLFSLAHSFCILIRFYFIIVLFSGLKYGTSYTWCRLWEI